MLIAKTTRQITRKNKSLILNNWMRSSRPFTLFLKITLSLHFPLLSVFLLSSLCAVSFFFSILPSSSFPLCPSLFHSFSPSIYLSFSLSLSRSLFFLSLPLFLSSNSSLFLSFPLIFSFSVSSYLLF